MSFFGFGKKKQEIKAAELVKVLLEEIFKDQHTPRTEHLNIPADKEDVFAAKVDFYKQAALLRVVIIHEQSNAKSAKVRKQLESILFRASTQEEGAVVVKEMKQAMLSLDELHDSVKPMSWSMNWLADIGINESNPVTLQFFGTFWIDFSLAFYKTLSDLDPT
jgi:hypothetical protein